MKLTIPILAGVILASLLNVARADQIQIDLTLPALQADPYHRPYVAIWLETPERQGVRTLTLWVEDHEWLKDLRQWWRKLGRGDQGNFDGASGATRKPGHYQLRWQTDSLPQGDYLLCLEASREAGGRDFLRQPIHLGGDRKQSYQLTGDVEFGIVSITID